LPVIKLIEEETTLMGKVLGGLYSIFWFLVFLLSTVALYSSLDYDYFQLTVTKLYNLLTPVLRLTTLSVILSLFDIFPLIFVFTVPVIVLTSYFVFRVSKELVLDAIQGQVAT